jgi:hypothetical protein
VGRVAVAVDALRLVLQLKRILCLPAMTKPSLRDTLIFIAIFSIIVAAMFATWETLRHDRELKKLERERRSENR